MSNKSHEMTARRQSNIINRTETGMAIEIAELWVFMIVQLVVNLRRIYDKENTMFWRCISELARLSEK